MLSTCYSCWLSPSATGLQKALTEKLTPNSPSLETNRNTDTLRLEDLHLCLFFFFFGFIVMSFWSAVLMGIFHIQANTSLRKRPSTTLSSLSVLLCVNSYWLKLVQKL